MKANTREKRPITSGNDHKPAALIDALHYAIKILKINEETETTGEIAELAVKRLPPDSSKNAKWLSVMKTIADLCVEKQYTLSQSALYDFLTLATKQMDEKHEGDIVFKIYRDIMENYQCSNQSLKANYPKVIVDTVSVLINGRDTTGKEVSSIGIDRYYQNRKSLAKSEVLTKKPSKSVDTIEKDHDLIGGLSQITGRETSSLMGSLRELESVDVEKLRDICLNYNKLQKYSRLISAEGQFKKELETELGRSLTSNQLQHAAVSVRKSRTYVENVLDGKFLPHGSHGINHVRHNLEYGYQLMGFIERKKRGSLSTQKVNG